jgi:hypothetical protein
MKRTNKPVYTTGDFSSLSFKETLEAEREELIACILADHQPFSMADTCSVIREHVKPFLNWHSIYEEQPVNEQAYFVCNEGSGYIGVAHYRNDMWRLDNTTHDYCLSEFEFFAEQPEGPLT